MQLELDCLNAPPRTHIHRNPCFRRLLDAWKSSLSLAIHLALLEWQLCPPGRIMPNELDRPESLVNTGLQFATTGYRVEGESGYDGAQCSGQVPNRCPFFGVDADVAASLFTPADVSGKDGDDEIHGSEPTCRYGLGQGREQDIG